MAITRKCVWDLFEGRAYKVFSNDLGISRPANRSYRPSKDRSCLRELRDNKGQYLDITCVNCDEAAFKRGKWDLFVVVNNNQVDCVENPFGGGT